MSKNSSENKISKCQLFSVQDGSNSSTLKKTGHQSLVGRQGAEDMDSNLERSEQRPNTEFNKAPPIACQIKLLKANEPTDSINNNRVFSSANCEVQISDSKAVDQKTGENRPNTFQTISENKIETECVSVPDEMDLSLDESDSRQLGDRLSAGSYNGDSLKDELECYESNDSSVLVAEIVSELEDHQPKDGNKLEERIEYTEVSILDDDLISGIDRRDGQKNVHQDITPIAKIQRPEFFDGYLIDEPGDSKVWVLRNSAQMRGQLHCSNCGSNQHSKGRCTVVDENNCLNCLGDHPRRYCESEGGCFICGSFEHIKARCKSKHKRRCLRCKRAHEDLECAYVLIDQQLIAKDNLEADSLKCLKCFELGHLSCSEVKMLKRRLYKV